jgi:hypothetical protein
MNAAMHAWFRTGIIGCTVLLALQSLWCVLPEIVRPPLPADSSANAADELVDKRIVAAGWAARFGALRGDLWADVALISSGLDWANGRRNLRPPTGRSLVKARMAAVFALRHSPHDARVWLALAALSNLTMAFHHQVVPAVKMSYYTGPNEAKLIPLRLLVAVQPGVLVDDEELQQLFRHELRTILGRRSELRSAIVAAYREAGPTARQLIEQEVILHRDQALLTELNASAH